MTPEQKNAVWQQVRDMCERLDFGRLEIVVQGGVPVRAERVIQQIKFDVTISKQQVDKNDLPTSDIVQVIKIT